MGYSISLPLVNFPVLQSLIGLKYFYYRKENVRLSNMVYQYKVQ